VKSLILSDIPEILPIIEGCLKLNRIDQDIWVKAIEWGTFGTESSIDHLTKQVETELNASIDYIIGSDTFYEPSRKRYLKKADICE
jgi:hypothetical protein